MAIKCLVLGAGQEVGKSCVVVTIGSKRIMFDCGMHMGFHDDRRYPAFTNISKDGDYTKNISCVIITHFHLDHIGALPYFTEVLGYEGPIYMTYPTKALAPLMLEDYRKVMVDRCGEEERFSFLQIQQCIKKVRAVNLKETVQVDTDLKIRAYYAGHVLGAAMFYVKSGDSSVVYTGDYNMTPDRHLGAAQIDRLFPDLLITESTYAITIRDSKHAREREFLTAVHSCVAGGGKVLIPVFALGRAQELCILLDDYWDRMNLKVPIYFSAGLTIQSNAYYKLLISWTNQNVKETYVSRNKFDFKHVVNFERSMINASGPCVLFATPGMISGGLSLDVFKEWAPSEKNLVALPGYCVAGTVGHKLMSGKARKIKLDQRTEIDVHCQVHVISFSAHTDSKGIMDLVKHVCPRHTVLVHGEKPQMKVLKSRICNELGIQCYDPANNECIEIPSHCKIRVDVTKQFLKSNVQCAQQFNQELVSTLDLHSLDIKSIQEILVENATAVEGCVISENARKVKVFSSDELETGTTKFDIMFVCCCPIYIQTGTIKLPERAHNRNGSAGEVSEMDQLRKRHCTIASKSINRDMEKQDSTNMKGDFAFSSLEAANQRHGFIQQETMRIESFNNVSDDTKLLDRLDKPGTVINQHPLKSYIPMTYNDVNLLHIVYVRLVQHLGSLMFQLYEYCIGGRSISICICTDEQCFYRTSDCPVQSKLANILCCSWSKEDSRLAEKVISVLGNIKINAEEDLKAIT